MKQTLHLTFQKSTSFVFLLAVFVMHAHVYAVNKHAYHSAFELGIKSLEERNAIGAESYFKQASKVKGSKEKDLKKRAKLMRIKSKKYFPEYFSFLNKGDQAFSRNSYKDAIARYKQGHRILRTSSMEKAVPDIDQKFIADITELIDRTNSVRISVIQDLIDRGDNEMRNGKAKEAMVSYKKAKSHMYKKEFTNFLIHSKIEKADSNIRYHQSFSNGDRALNENRLQDAEKAFENARHYAITTAERNKMDERLHYTIQLIYDQSMDKAIKAYQFEKYSEAISSFKHARKYILKKTWDNTTHEVDKWLFETNIRLSEVLIGHGELAFSNKSYASALANFNDAHTYLVAAGEYGSPAEISTKQGEIDKWISETKYGLFIGHLDQANQLLSEHRFEDALNVCENAYAFTRNNSDTHFIEEKKGQILTFWQEDLMAQARAAYFHGSLASLKSASDILAHARSLGVEPPATFFRLESNVIMGLKDAFLAEGHRAYVNGDFPISLSLFLDAKNYFPNDQLLASRIDHLHHLQKAIELKERKKLDRALQETELAKRSWHTTEITELENDILISIRQYDNAFKKAILIFEDSDQHPKQAKRFLNKAKSIYPNKAKKNNIENMFTTLNYIEKADQAFRIYDISDAKALFSRSIQAYSTSYAQEKLNHISRYEEHLKRGDQFFESDPQKAIAYYQAAIDEIPTPDAKAKLEKAKEKVGNEEIANKIYERINEVKEIRLKP